MKLLITGGHATPALAVIDRLQKEKKDVQIVFVGRRYTSDSKKEESMEYKEVSKRKLPFVHLRAGRFTRTFTVQALFHLLAVPSGFFQAYRILKKHHPDRILCFGGYIALPIALAGAFLSIPVYTHEQTLHPGLANRVISRISKKVFISFKDSKKYFPSHKVVLSGNPIRESVLKVVNTPFSIEKDEPVLYVTGGALGSHSVNVLLEQIVQKLLSHYTIVHQTGNVTEYGDFERLTALRNNLPTTLQKKYHLLAHISSEDLGYIYSRTDLVIGRAGANTFFELLSLKIPAIFIPLPWSAHNEQRKQAKLFEKWGVGEVFEQDGKAEKLYTLIHSTMTHLNSYKQSFEAINFQYPSDAASLIIKTVVG